MVLTFNARGPHFVRPIRLECQNKYFLVWTSSSVNNSIILYIPGVHIQSEMQKILLTYFEIVIYIASHHKQNNYYGLINLSSIYIHPSSAQNILNNGSSSMFGFDM